MRMSRRRKSKGNHTHAEAFCIMRYDPIQICNENHVHRLNLPSIFIWNSRDGVTPFSFNLRNIEYMHCDWKQDKYDPHYIPKAGELIFRDWTAEENRIFCEKRVEEYWESKDASVPSMKNCFPDKETAIFSLMQNIQPGEPQLFQVTEEWLKITYGEKRK